MDFSATLLRRLVALLMLAALPLHALAVHCEVRCTMSGTAVPQAGDMTMQMDPSCPGCHQAQDDCPHAAQCAAAHAVALPSCPAVCAPEGHHPTGVQPERAVLSHTCVPPERPPRRA